MTSFSLITFNLIRSFLFLFELFYCFSLRKKFPYSDFFWSVFPRIQTEYGEIRSISPYSVRMRENTNQKNFEYEHFSRSAYHLYRLVFVIKDLGYVGLYLDLRSKKVEKAEKGTLGC